VLVLVRVFVTGIGSVLAVACGFDTI